MARVLAVCFIVLLTCIGIAQAQDETPAPAEPAATIADQVWNPSAEQLSAWVAGGIAAAALELDFLDLPVADRMSWTSDEGVPLTGDRALRFAALITPELTAQTVGYGAAWEEDTWAAIEEDAGKVAGDLATALGASVAGGPMYFTLAVHGSQYDDMMAAVSYQGQWRTLKLEPWGTVADYTPDELGEATADPQWAAQYLVTQHASHPALQPAEEVRVYLLTWVRNASTDVSADFLAEAPKPDWTDDSRARLVVGDADLLAWVDFDIVP